MLQRYTDGLQILRERYHVKMHWTPGRERGYLSAPDAERAAALNDAIRDPDVRAIFCVRGGYGCLRLLDDLDYAAARDRETLLIGYSDVTALHLALHRHAGWTGLSGPVVTEWPQIHGNRDYAPALHHLNRWLDGDVPSLTALDGHRLHPLSDGTATGPLLGGNLAVLSRLVGTRHVPDFSGALLFLEDVDEAPYQVDRMLAHLRLAGVLDDLAGVVIGTFSTGDLDPDKPTLSLNAVFEDYFADRPYPVATGLAYGHHLPRVTVPVGVDASLSVSGENALLTIPDPAGGSSDANG